MTALEGLLAHHAALPPENRTLLRFSGPDHVRYLNGQLTNELREVPPDQAVHSCVTDTKGRLMAEVRVFRHDDALWIEAPRELRDALAGRLDRYLVADEVEWSDVSDGWRLLHVVGETPDSMAGTIPSGGMARHADRLGIAGLDIWLPTAAAAAADKIIEQLGTLDHDRAETIRIVRGAPAWGAELTEGILPPEAGLDRSAISYTKGCYIGQEVLSRIHSVGRVNRNLGGFTVPADVPGDGLPGSELRDPGSGKAVGTLTSVAPLILEGEARRRALGFLSRQAGDLAIVELATAAGRIEVEVARDDR
jgi:folate-binding protein YgfZ